MSDWISGNEAATIIGVSRTTLYRTLADPTERAQTWGEENVGWRYKPLARRRRIFQVDRTRAQRIANGDLKPADS